jgi:hypothetical protein
MLQFLVSDHLQGYELPSIRTKSFGRKSSSHINVYGFTVEYLGLPRDPTWRYTMRYDDTDVLYEDGIVVGYSVIHEDYTRVIALSMGFDCVEVLYEDGTERCYQNTWNPTFKTNKEGVARSYKYID